MSTTCGVTAAGSLWCWGHTNNRQIDNGPGSYRTTPVAVLSSSVVRHVGTGWQVCATTTALTYCWGDNGRDADGIGAVDYGQPGSDILGTGAGLVRTVFPPAPVIGSNPLWSGIAVGPGFICAHALPSGPASCWGVNGYGQLGDSTTQWRSTPAPVADSIPFISIGTGSFHACGLSTAGDVWCWGRNNVGQLGTGSTASSSVPMKIVSTAGPFARLTVGSVGACAISAAGDTWCWGNNSAGEIGDGTLVTRRTPVKVSP